MYLFYSSNNQVITKAEKPLPKLKAKASNGRKNFRYDKSERLWKNVVTTNEG